VVIKNNLEAMNAGRHMGIVASGRAKSTEKLSSGYQINRAADNAAGLAISEKMRKQVRGLDRAARNIEDGIGYVQVADGALREVHDMLQRVNELAVQAANGTNSPSDREHINREVQQIKSEMERIFVTTSFNERKIWEDTEHPVINVMGDLMIQSATPSTPYLNRTVTNDNYDKISLNNYAIQLDETGMVLSWTGYNGTDYQTSVIGWDKFNAKNNWSFQIADYFRPEDKDLFDSAGNPVFDFPVSFSVSSDSRQPDIIKALNGTYVYSHPYSSISASFEEPNKGGAMHMGSASIVYTAAYASRTNATNNTPFDFNNGSDSYIEPSSRNGNMIAGPSATTVAAARNDTQPWVFEFEMDGIGTVTGTSSSISYWAPSDRDDDDYGYWWDWSYYSDGSRRKSTITHSASGDLKGLMGALTGKKGSADVAGLLTAANGGDCDHGGTIQISFDLRSKNDYTYGKGQTSNAVGSFYMSISVSPSDTEQTIFNKVRDALNSRTVVDLQTNSTNNSYFYNQHYSFNNSPIQVKRYLIDYDYDDIDLSIHSGANVIDKIPMKYECLRLATLGMTDTNVLTEEEAGKTLDTLTGALRIVSHQRSVFGAYQNRLEHAFAVDKNASENTQSAESRIRDTDMAKEMIQYSNFNILEQSGTAMLAQANQSNNLALSLLG